MRYIGTNGHQRVLVTGQAGNSHRGDTQILGVKQRGIPATHVVVGFHACSPTGSRQFSELVWLTTNYILHFIYNKSNLTETLAFNLVLIFSFKRMFFKTSE